MDEEILTKLVLGCAKFVLDDPSIQNFEIRTQSAKILEQGKGKKDGGGNSKGTGVFHPRNTYSQNSLCKTHFGTGVFLGMPPTSDHQKKNKLKEEMKVQTSPPKKEVKETKESFELFNDICLPSEWPY
nr:hypothetical protein Iba_chr11aCG15270 [Ipomoea batatas]